MASSARAGSRKRGAAHYSSRGDRGSPAGQRPRHQVVLEGFYQNEDLLHSITSLVGCRVQVQLRNGDVYEGILRTASSEMDLALELACLKPTTEQPLSKKLVKSLRLRWGSVVSVFAVGVVTGQQKGDIFKTDGEISRTNANGHITSRELQPFEFDDGMSGGVEEEDSFEGQGKGWAVEEMFQINKEKFNYKSSFNEDLREYTTQISESDSPEFLCRRERAAQLEQEIESQDSKSRQGLDDALTEEERYSAVVRQDATMMTTTTILPEPSLQSSSTPVNGRDREEVEREGGMTPVLYDGNKMREDGQAKELETLALTVPDKDKEVDTQNDSGLPEDSAISEEVPEDSSPNKTLVDSKDEGGRAGTESTASSCQNEPESAKKQSSKEVVRTFQLNPEATEFRPSSPSPTPSRAVIASPMGPTQAAWESLSPVNPVPVNPTPVGSMSRPPRKGPRVPRPPAPSYPFADQFAAIYAGYNPALMAAAAAGMRPLQMSGGQVISQQLSLAVTGASMTPPTAMMPVMRPQGLYPQVPGALYNTPSFQLPAAPSSGQPLSQLYAPSSSQAQQQLQPVLSPQLASPTGQQQIILLPNSSLQPLTGQGSAFLAGQPVGGGMPAMYPQHHHHHHGK